MGLALGDCHSPAHNIPKASARANMARDGVCSSPTPALPRKRERERSSASLDMTPPRKGSERIYVLSDSYFAWGCFRESQRQAVSRETARTAINLFHVKHRRPIA